MNHQILKVATVIKYILSVFIILMVTFSTLNAQEKKIDLSAELTPPYAFMEDGKVRGIYYEMLQAVFQTSKYTFDIKIRPPKRSSLMAKKGEIDGIVGAPKDIFLFEGEIFSDTFFTIALSPIALKETQIPYQSIDDLKLYKIGVVRDAGFEKTFPSLKFQVVTRTEQNVVKLFVKRIQVIIEDPVIIHYLIDTKYPQFRNLYKIFSPLTEIDVVIGFSLKAQNYKDKLETFNNGLTRIKKDGTYLEILQKWGVDSYNSK
jgi:polar amino acid transport system substrate-binding protein